MIQTRLPESDPVVPDTMALGHALEGARVCLERRRSEQWQARELVESIAIRVAALAAEAEAAAPAYRAVLQRNLAALRDEQRRHSDRYAALCESWPSFRDRQEIRIAELERLASTPN
ncbi:hypothetical protein [Mangrovicoccus sp. HB161399]|uniref:hypothetical protein n=1 Tax=Mangrovicoccus sp. HB161399 TaxID=2720392 RepID=UPI00155670EB|nr:hypothetical protein [Mangrovicoccus sp. HB161399]